MPDKPRIFISYARSDGSEFAKNLHRHGVIRSGFTLKQS